MIILADNVRFIDAYNAAIATISTITVIFATLIIPILVKKSSNRKIKMDAAQEAIDSAFDKYHSDQSKINDFDWYFAEICAVQKKYDVTSIRCLNCSKVSSCDKYNEWFKTRLRNVPEVNNFSFKSGKLNFKIQLSVLLCYNCVNDKKVKPFIDKESVKK
ncbi:hypothetical protein [Spiroplasma tabanidicola]|uniref:Transmembrane protein n=1 Tax=Spiroplasma tabanidicola TaxID=324079 RepID=A0A6I6CDY6_9MOLU|nr:hypothetical protein [Spiroplasma tabanidicola]QGS52184.1 hypothetical protein STABA_v1c08290 [Spiroplasma tabanidicola]